MDAITCHHLHVICHRMEGLMIIDTYTIDRLAALCQRCRRCGGGHRQ